MNSQSNPSQLELKLWLSAVEYQFTERKSKTDKGGWLKTIVAFANSTPANTVSVLYIGANNDGSLEGMTDREIEDTMKSVGAYIQAHSWPLINIIPIPLEKDGKKCLVMIVPYSAQRPHFAGRAYVRRGTETIDASDAQYEELIATRNTKTREILKWLNKEITFMTPSRRVGASDTVISGQVIVKTCTQLFVTLDFVQPMGYPPKTESFSLHSIEVTFDNAKNRLALLRYGDR